MKSRMLFAALLVLAATCHAAARDCKVNYIGPWLEPVPRGPLVKLMEWKTNAVEQKENERRAIALFEQSGNKLDADDCGAPLLAAARGYAMLMERFIDAKVDLYAGTALTKGMTPLLAAAAEGNLDVVKVLLERHAAKVNEATPMRLADMGALVGGQTALHWAAMEGRTDVVTYLVEHGARVNEKGWDGRTALDWARQRNYPDVVNVLLQHGAKSAR